MPFFKPRCKMCHKSIDGCSTIVEYRDTKGKIYKCCSSRCGDTFVEYMKVYKGEYVQRVGGFFDTVNSLLGSANNKVSTFNNIVTGLNDFLDGLNGK